MPEGTVRWFDEVHLDAEVVAGGHAYHVPAGAIDHLSCHPGARVHFDLERVDGVEQAVGVRLRQSARASRHRHRLGSLSGARRFDTKGPSPVSGTHPELHLAESHPLQVARSWATAVSRGDVAGALALYGPGATVHAEGGSVTGRGAIQGWLEACPARGCGRHARVRGDGEAVVEWAPEEAGAKGMAVRCRIAHGSIAEQWPVEVPEVAARPGGGGGPAPVAVYRSGPVGARATERAQAIVSRAAARLGERVLFARVKLTRDPDPARDRPARAEVLLDLNGEPMRVHATGHEMTEAVDLLDRRVRDRIEHRARRREDLHRSSGIASPGEWRHGDLEPAPPPFSDRPPAERRLVRHKTFAAGELTCDEALFDMEQLDYDFYLFVDLATGLDSVVERIGPSYRVTRVRPSAVALGPTAAPVELSQAAVPVLSVREAVERLGASGERRLFFADAASGRGSVLYLRFDGHYGLLVPE